MIITVVMRFYFLLISLSFSLISFGQADETLAAEYFKKGNYFKAMDEYKKCRKLDRANGEYNLKIGICYLETNIDKPKALEYLLISKKSDKQDKELDYYLGVAYAINHQMDDAIKALESYLESGGKNTELAEKRLKDCQYALKAMQNPARVQFENLGEDINSEFADYYPFVSGDERTLSFTTRRKGKGKMEYDGYYPSDVYLSTFDGKKFSKAEIMKSNMTPYNEQSTGLSQDGQTMFFYSDNNPKGELFIVKNEGYKFGRKEKIVNIDDEKFLESAVCISPDGQTMIYSSNRNDGIGQLDLWMVRRLPFGDNLWAEPQLIGGNVNTAGSEDFPSFSPDGTRIYFSSNGHVGMGGWDLYYTDWDPENNTFSDVEALPYPVNTADDERSISFADDHKHAYISASKPDGVGDLDIYRITYDDVEVTPALFAIKIATGNPDSPFMEAERFTITDATTNEIIGEYSPNPNNMTYTVIIQPGEYTIEIIPSSEDYQLYSAPFKVHEFMNQMGKVDKIINLKKNN